MNNRIYGESVVCPKCGKTNFIFEDGMKYPANVQEVLYCASCNEILGYKSSTRSLDTRIEEDNQEP